MKELDPNTLSAGAGILLTLGFSYVPKLNAKFATLQPTTKRLVMLALLFVVAAGAFGLSCAGVLTGLFGYAVTCDQPGALGLVSAFVYAAIANQTIFSISPQTKAVQGAKAAKAA